MSDTNTDEKTKWAPKHKIEEILSPKILAVVQDVEREHANCAGKDECPQANATIQVKTLRHWYNLAERYNLVLAEMQAHINELEPKAALGSAVEAMPEGTGVCKNMHGFCDMKRDGSAEHDKWHTCGKIFCNAIEAVPQPKEETQS